MRETLTSQQWDTLRAAMKVIIPPDDDPGALEAGVETYFRQQFDRDLQDFVIIYQHGLDALDAEALASTGEPFATIPLDTQEFLLTRIEHGSVQTAWPIDPRMFFSGLVDHCAEGFYSDPSNGGNRDGAAWKMIGFEVTA